MLDGRQTRRAEARKKHPTWRVKRHYVIHSDL